MGVFSDRKTLTERAHDGITRGDWGAEKPSVLTKILAGGALLVAALVKEKWEADARKSKSAGSNDSLWDGFKALGGYWRR